MVLATDARLRPATPACLVTGGTRGIGQATARRLLARGARVTIAGRTEAPCLTAAASMSCSGVAGDLSIEDDAVRVVAEAARTMDGLDVLIANAGIVGASVNLADMPVAEFDRVVSVNLRGTFLACREASRVMRDAGTGGRIVIVASACAYLVEPNAGHYNATKAALLGLARSLAVDLGEWGIRVNTVAPGLTDTDQTVGYVTDDLKIGVANRAAAADEIASVIEYLALDAPDFMIGASVVVDGGQTIRGADGPG